MLRTVVVSTQANRFFGPPDGIATGKFDSLLRANGWPRVLYRPASRAAKAEVRPRQPGAKHYTIILPRERRSDSFFAERAASKQRAGGDAFGHSNPCARWSMAEFDWRIAECIGPAAKRESFAHRLPRHCATAALGSLLPGGRTLPTSHPSSAPLLVFALLLVQLPCLSCR